MLAPPVCFCTSELKTTFKFKRFSCRIFLAGTTNFIYSWRLFRYGEFAKFSGSSCFWKGPLLQCSCFLFISVHIFYTFFPNFVSLSLSLLSSQLCFVCRKLVTLSLLPIFTVWTKVLLNSFFSYKKVESTFEIVFISKL